MAKAFAIALAVVSMLAAVYVDSELSRIERYSLELEQAHNVLAETLYRMESDGIDVDCYSNAPRFHAVGCNPNN